MVVASVTAGVGASVSVELVFITVLICDMFLETTRQLELGAADLALVHSPVLLSRVLPCLRPGFKDLRAIESISLCARVLLFILVLVVSGLVPLQLARIQEPLATGLTVVRQNL